MVGWLKTSEGKAYDRSKRAYDIDVRPDGRFRVEDVPAGKYELHVEVRGPRQGVPRYRPEVANTTEEITVPEMPGGRSDEPLDVGTIELKPA